MRVVGTAGHVDHGKSTLVAALTGIHPDRLKEEQAREMTIDLGFAWLTLPDGESVGIVDVPGHRDFIENMLAGVGGIDAALFVVAADEGVMPQTREHLAILDLLQIPAGIIVLTKIDLMDDPEWLEMVEVDVRSATLGTVLENSPVVRVSARSGAGIPELKTTLAEVLNQRPPRPDLGRPRLPVDRIFTIPGFGTVVTGTLLDGRFQTGDEVEILPAGVRGRVRGLQTHKEKEEIALPGSRTAVNISGVEVEQIQRGNVLVHPRQYHTSRLLDAHFRLLKDVSTPITHNMDVKFYLGADEVQARLRLLGMERLEPGQEAWIQLELAHEVVAVRGDHYILRRPSPGETIGGGMIADPQPSRRHKRFDPAILQKLEALLQGTPGEVLFQACLGLGIAPLRDCVRQAHLSNEQVSTALQEVLENQQLIQLEDGSLTPASDLLVAPRAGWESLSTRAIQMLESFHQANPLRRGMPREELKSRLHLQPRAFNAAVHRWVEKKQMMESGALVWLPDFSIRFTPAQKAQLDRLLAQFAQSPFAPPTIKDCITAVGEEVYQAMLETALLVSVSPEVVFRKADYDKLLNLVKAHFDREPTLSVAQLRDQLNTSRRYVLALLEHLDAAGVTLRDGDIRKLRQVSAR
jgi:selenocysteine-specific elongation factor